MGIEAEECKLVILAKKEIEKENSISGINDKIEKLNRLIALAYAKRHSLLS